MPFFNVFVMSLKTCECINVQYVSNFIKYKILANTENFIDVLICTQIIEKVDS